MFDVAILGGGPAGCAAGVYAARKQLNTILITDTFGGQSIVSPGIENWIGDQVIPGNDLAKKLENHVKKYESDDFKVHEGEKVADVQKIDGGFSVTTDKGSYEAKTVLITTGSHRRKLPVPGADEFEHKGITYCASCDGPFFSGKDVVVVGGGNAGFESAAQLLAYTNSVTLLQRSDRYKADPVTVETVLADPKMTGVLNAQIKEIRGENFVTEIVYEVDGAEVVLPTGGIFVEIGAEPTTGYVADLIELTPYKQVVADPRNQRTSVDGIWAAGDCTDGLYHQNNIAAGDAVKALEDIYIYLKTNS